MTIRSAQSKFVEVNGVRTHYLEAGQGARLVLLHSGEFGGCAELSWERNIDQLAQHFHVLAPDWVGFGQTEKLFSFDDMWNFRVRHITRFLQVMGVSSAHFIGNSMGGTMLLAVAAQSEPVWPIKRLIAVAGGGEVPENSARDILNSYDGSREHMRRIIETVFIDQSIREDETYLDRRQESARTPGAWECTAAVRFKAPWSTVRSMPTKPDYRQIRCPVLLVTGEKDALRAEGFGQALQSEIPAAELHVVRNAGHCPHIERPDEFNRRAIEFLTSTNSITREREGE